MNFSHFILQGLDQDDDHIAGLENVFSLSPLDWGLVGTAFMNAAGASLLSALIGDNREVVDVYVGIRNGVTSKQAIEILLHNGISPFVVDTASQAYIFHPKVYITRNSSIARLIIGSANVTSGGMAKNIEAGLLCELSMHEDRELIESVFGQFDILRSSFPENIFQVNNTDDLDRLVEEDLLIDESCVAFHANTRSVTGRRIEQRIRMPLRTRRMPRPNRVIHSPQVMEQVVGTTLNVATVTNRRLLWKSSNLKRRDLNIPEGSNTNRTGSMLFKKGDASQDIDQRFYFRHEVFADENWTFDPRPAFSHFERCTCQFRFVIKGIDYGVYALRLSHNTRTDTPTYAQRNSMTQIHWGDALRLIAREDLLDSICRLYAPEDDHVYTLVFDDE